jgi:uncharacterized membrane protein YsdA (DUF1294 family)
MISFWYVLPVLYLLLMNVIGFVMMGLDKRKAIRHVYRIPEASLFTVAWLGGSVGCLLGMYMFRHKTRKRKFVYGMPLIFIFELAIFVYLLRLR